MNRPANFNVDDAIAVLNDASVSRCQVRVNCLSSWELDAVMKEYLQHPDQRFGDNLLVCLSRQAFEEG